MKRLWVIVALIALALLAWWLIGRGSRPDIAELPFPEDESPAAVIADPFSPRLGDHSREGEHRLAVLVTEPDSDWIGLVRAFDAHGIPYDITDDPMRAMRQQAVLVYPTISGAVLSGDEIRALADHIRTGNMVMTTDLAGGGLEELFGVSARTPSRERQFIRWERAETDAPEDVLAYFSADESEAAVGSWAYTPSTAQVLARFDDGEAAVLCRNVGGRACLLGLDVGSLAQRSMNGRSALVAGSFVNSYQPSLDVLVRFLRDIYIEADDDPYLVDTARRGTSGTLILTHDIDYSRSMRNALAYADMLRDNDVGGTFFVQTKYVKDWNDDSFFNADNVGLLKQIAPGMEIGSHGVSHSRIFDEFEMGDGSESYPDYLPFVENQNSARDGTVLGELRVSKYLLRRAIGREIVSFRPGHLSYPPNLPEALAATGYAFDSTLTAPEAGTHLPFMLTHARSGEGLVDVLEVPVTIEDERDPPMLERLDDAVTVINKIAAHRGVAVLLNHPDVLAPKLTFEQRLIETFKDRMWITSLGEFGRWWRNRNATVVAVSDRRIFVSSPEKLSGLDLIFPKRGGQRVGLDGAAGKRTITVD